MTEGTDGNTSTKEQLPRQVAIDFIKSNSFRVIHVDGIWGGATSPTTIQMALYSQRPVIPQRVVHKVTAEGGLGEELRDERVSRPALLVREVECDAIMSVDTAKVILTWLYGKVRDIEPDFRIVEPAEENAE